MDNLYKLDKAEHDEIYVGIAKKILPNNPRVIITGGQPGSGKGTLAALAMQELEAFGAAIKIDADDLRDRHPQYKQLQRDNDREAATHVHPDASAWAKRLMNDAVAKRVNIVIDQSSKNSDSVLKQVEKLRSADYQIELRVMAVNAEISEQRIHTRYEDEKADKVVGRFVPLDVHEEAYTGLAKTLAAVEREKAVDVLGVYDKKQEIIYENRLKDGQWQAPTRAPEVLNNERDRFLTVEERKAQVAEYERLAQMLDDRGASPAERGIIEENRIQSGRNLTAATFYEESHALIAESRESVKHLSAQLALIQEEVKQMFALKPDDKVNPENLSAKTAVNDLRAIKPSGTGEELKQTAKFIAEKLDEIRKSGAESSKAEIRNGAMAVAALCNADSGLAREIASAADTDSRPYIVAILKQGNELASQLTQEHQVAEPSMGL